MSIKTHNSNSRSENNIKFIDFNGSIDTFNINDVVEYIDSVLLDATEETIVFNMEELNFINAQGIGFLIEIINKYKENKYIYMMKINKKIEELFDLLGFKNCCKLINDINEIGSDTTVFPVKIKCPSCNKEHTFIKSGKFNCSSCQNQIYINKSGEVE